MHFRTTLVQPRGLSALTLLFLLGTLAGSDPLGAEEPSGVLVGSADPTIIAAPGKSKGYYVFATGRGLPFYHSTDLVHWRRVGRVFPTPVPRWAAEKVPGTRGIWAPHIEQVGDLYYLYYSCSTFGKQRSVIGLAVNRALDPSDPLYRWEDRGEVMASKPGDSFNAIDAAMFLDGDGRAYLFWGSFWSGIKAIELDPKTGKPKPKARRIDIADRREPPNAIEAPYVIFRHEYYWLFVSFDVCCEGARSTYRVMVGRAEKVSGPYLDASGRSLLEGGGTLVLASHGRWRGPGHNSILQEGNRDWLVHHTYDMENLRRHRLLQIRPLYWPENDWPVVGEPLVLTHRKPRATITSRTVAGTWSQRVDYREDLTHPIELLDGGKIRGANEGSTWILRGNRLTIRRKNPDAPGGEWLDEVVVESTGESYVGRNQNHAIIRGQRAQRKSDTRP